MSIERSPIFTIERTAPTESLGYPWGIDLSARPFSCVAQVDAKGACETLPSTSTVTRITRASCYLKRAVSSSARRRFKDPPSFRPEMIARCVKREMGKPLFCGKQFEGRKAIPPESDPIARAGKTQIRRQWKVGPGQDDRDHGAAYFSEPKLPGRAKTPERLARSETWLDIINERQPPRRSRSGSRRVFPRSQRRVEETPRRSWFMNLGGGTFRRVASYGSKPNRFRVTIATDGGRFSTRRDRLGSKNRQPTLPTPVLQRSTMLDPARTRRGRTTIVGVSRRRETITVDPRPT